MDSGAALVALWEEGGLDVPAALRTRLVAEGGRRPRVSSNSGGLLTTRSGASASSTSPWRGASR